MFPVLREPAGVIQQHSYGDGRSIRGFPGGVPAAATFAPSLQPRRASATSPPEYRADRDLRVRNNDMAGARISRRPTALALLLPKRLHRIDAGGPSCGRPAGSHRDRQQNSQRDSKRQPIDGPDLVEHPSEGSAAERRGGATE